MGTRISKDTKSTIPLNGSVAESTTPIESEAKPDHTEPSATELTTVEPAALSGADLEDEDDVVDDGPVYRPKHSIADLKVRLLAECLRAHRGRGAEKLEQNVVALMDLLMKLKPSTAKGTYLRSIALSTTMGPSVRLDPADVLSQVGK